jgi:hypothetical protein
MIAAMTAASLAVPRAPFDMEDPWEVPAACTPVALRRATDGGLPRLPTRVAAFFDDRHLTILFSATDDFVRTNYDRDDEPLYEDDVVEVFITPGELTRYYEFEVSPNGAVFDATVDSPDGSRETMHVDRAWNCTGVVAAVRTVVDAGGAMIIDTLLRIPFAALDRNTPVAGETWRANFFRVDRHDRGDEYSAWQPTLRDPADFHVPAAFGALRF